jgi:hypothetical protein
MELFPQLVVDFRMLENEIFICGSILAVASNPAATRLFASIDRRLNVFCFADKLSLSATSYITVGNGLASKLLDLLREPLSYSYPPQPAYR